MFYDSMIAKLLTYGKDRNEAIQRMREALGSFYIDGISHNMSFLEAIMYNEKFKKGDISTSFIKQEFSKGFSGLTIENKDEGVLIGTAIYMYIMNENRLLGSFDVSGGSGRQGAARNRDGGQASARAGSALGSS